MNHRDEQIIKNIVVHKYQTLKMRDVYQTVMVDFIELKRLLEEIRKDL